MNEEDPGGVWEAPLRKLLLDAGADKDNKIIETLTQASQTGTLSIQIGDMADIDSGGDTAYAKDQAVALIIKNLTMHAGVADSGETKKKNEVLSDYRRLLIKTLQHLPLRGLDRDESDPSGNKNRLELDRVYTELDTRTPVRFAGTGKKRRSQADDTFELGFDPEDKEKTRPLSALEASAANRHLVILGDPGSGKSTFVNHLTLCLATYDSKACLTERLSCWPENETDITPVPVILRDFAKQMSCAEKAEVRHLWEFITERMKSQNLDFAEDALEDALDRGKAIVLLDGLDEIPTQEKRTFVRDAVTAFVRRYEKSRFIVTCRVLSYQSPEWKREGLNPKKGLKPGMCFHVLVIPVSIQIVLPA
ncbi:MAG: NACHT domain-containing protein [Desulfobacterales bacterium]|nr:NACHT domain-containing protein [Desulfobacterales bacterium]